MKPVNIQDAKRWLPELVRRAEAGEEVVITRRNQPAVRLVPVTEPTSRRCLGALAGQIRLAEDFDAPLDDFADYR
jgi:prevent-host-death family protein